MSCGNTGMPAKRSSKKSAVPDPELVALGRRARALREAAGLTQEEVAHRADLHWSYIGQIERASTNPTYMSIVKLARGLDVSPAKLVDD